MLTDSSDKIVTKIVTKVNHIFFKNIVMKNLFIKPIYKAYL